MWIEKKNRFDTQVYTTLKFNAEFYKYSNHKTQKYIEHALNL